jgi:GT2 family glycosyltransferase
MDISVIIPFKDKAQMTLAAVASLFAFGPGVREVLLVSNNSSAKELKAVEDGIRDYSNVRIIEQNIPFNYHKINNHAVKCAAGEYLLFLNNDVQLVTASKGLIERMVEKSGEPEVGVVGCTLLYGDERTIQHAGVFLVPGGTADHLYIGKKYEDAINEKNRSMFPYDIKHSMPVTAVTGAAQIVSRKIFDSVCGFHENFILCGGDVDLCIRLNKAGFQTWFVGGGYMLHKESVSRQNLSIPYSDFTNSYKSYSTVFDSALGDPFMPEITKNMKAGA